MLWVLSCAFAAPAEVREQDLVFHRSRSEQARVLEAATHSPLTHVGVVTVRDGAPWVLEAHPLGDFDLSDPAVCAAAEARWERIPVEEPVVAPVDVFVDPDLVPVAGSRAVGSGCRRRPRPPLGPRAVAEMMGEDDPRVRDWDAIVAEHGPRS